MKGQAYKYSHPLAAVSRGLAMQITNVTRTMVGRERLVVLYRSGYSKLEWLVIIEILDRPIALATTVKY
jgi:hypothetical protein